MSQKTAVIIIKSAATQATILLISFLNHEKK